jgi:hypothetical protein
MTLKTPTRVPSTEWSEKFLQGMIDRMSVSYFKYGAVADAYPSKVNALRSLQQRIDKYLDTHNTEYLIDAANFCLIEFMYPSISGASYQATDSDGSPGRVWNDGEVTAKGNNPVVPISRRAVREGD